MADTELLQQARARALAGRSPAEAGRAKDLAALRWVYRWGWSTPTIVDMIASPGRRGVAARLVRRGLAKRHPTPAGGGVRGVPTDVITLTADGVAELEAALSEADMLAYPSKPEQAIQWRQLRHDTLVQLYTARRLADISGYMTPRELAEKSVAGQKQPDAVWIAKNNSRIAVELEMTAKKGRELDQTILALIKAVQPKTEFDKKGPYDIVAILSQSRAILDTYKRRLAPDAEIALYRRNSSRQYERCGKKTVPDWIKGRIIFQEITLW